MEATNPILSLRGWSCGYRDEPIVRDLDLDLPRGSVTCIVGSNGAGKSTILRSVYGTIKRFSGSLLLDGRSIDALSPTQRMARGISFVPQGRCNFPYLSVAENMELAAYTLDRGKVRTAIDRQVADFPVLSRRWRVAAGNLSGGEQQMLEMAMVLLADPKLLLIDEPSLGLSPKVMHEVFAIIRAQADKGIGVLMVEQNVRGGLAISDHALVMDLGRKVMHGPTRDVQNDERIRTVFLGGAPA